MCFGGLVERESAIYAGFQFAVGKPAVDLLGAGSLFLGRSVEHGETMQRTALHVKWADGERRPCISAGHNDHAAACSKARDGPIKIGFSLCLPPDMNAGTDERFYSSRNVVRLVVEDKVCAELLAKFNFFRRTGGG